MYQSLSHICTFHIVSHSGQQSKASVVCDVGNIVNDIDLYISLKHNQHEPSSADHVTLAVNTMYVHDR